MEQIKTVYLQNLQWKKVRVVKSSKVAAKQQNYSTQPHTVQYTLYVFENFISYYRDDVVCCRANFACENLYNQTFISTHTFGSESRWLHQSFSCSSVELFVLNHLNITQLFCSAVTVFQFQIRILLATGNSVQCAGHCFGSQTRMCFTKLVLSRGILA